MEAERRHYNVTLAILTLAGIAFALQQTMVIPALPTETDVATGMNTVMRTVGGVVGGQVGAALLAAHTIPGTNARPSG